ncbi:hypothetical protein C6P46_005175 [Rhodotorula mucilaginosa]|uniref:F-box domain-containing protein n=1 Tax=Rhodotorula mucilaginosa TaxID=5537 RepID=A0A9P7B4T8_RHOMI|nr:hypothetical protein C6P46_005175 [Rhodotorula mucilaginosa]
MPTVRASLARTSSNAKSCLGPTNHHTDKPRRLYRQILSHADVDDLLLLRQTSKSLYRLLRGSDGEAVWSRFFANKGLPVLKAGVLKPWQYAEMALCRRCTTSTSYVATAANAARKLCSASPISRRTTLIRTPAGSFAFWRATASSCDRHAFRADYETLNKYLWSLQAQDDADSSLHQAGSQTDPRKTASKKGPDAFSPGPRIAKFVKERQRIKKLVKQHWQECH